MAIYYYLVLSRFRFGISIHPAHGIKITGCAHPTSDKRSDMCAKGMAILATRSGGCCGARSIILMPPEKRLLVFLCAGPPEALILNSRWRFAVDFIYLMSAAVYQMLTGEVGH